MDELAMYLAGGNQDQPGFRGDRRKNRVDRAAAAARKMQQQITDSYYRPGGARRRSERANVNQSRMGSMNQSNAWRAGQSGSAAQSFAEEQMNLAKRGQWQRAVLNIHGSQMGKDHKDALLAAIGRYAGL